MNLEELKQNYPKLYEQIQGEMTELKNQVEAKDKEIEKLKNDNENLSETNKKYEDRIVKLEKSEQLRKEQDLKDQAKGIVDKHLKESGIPDRLHNKVRQQLNHNDFVENKDEGPVLDVEKFTEQVKAEVKDWSDTLNEFAKDPAVLGVTGGEDQYEDEEKKFEDLADQLVSLSSGKKQTHKEQ